MKSDKNEKMLSLHSLPEIQRLLLFCLKCQPCCPEESSELLLNSRGQLLSAHSGPLRPDPRQEKGAWQGLFTRDSIYEFYYENEKLAHL